MRVLYVDDDRVNGLLFVEMCRMANSGVVVHTAGSAQEALEVIAGVGADLLVLDLHLPDGDGLSLLPRLRDEARSDAGELPAYLCSADDPAQTAPLAQAAGFTGCLGKPLDLALVLATLARHAPHPAGSASA